MSTFQAVINPLMSLDIASAAPSDPPPPADRILAFVFAADIEATPASFTARYRELAKLGAWLPIAFAETSILQKLVWPLKSAIGSCSLGNYLSCIGTPPAGNANYPWVQHFINHLAPTGLAGLVLANGSMSYRTDRTPR